METPNVVNNFLPSIIEFETDYEIVYKDYIEHIDRVDISSSVDRERDIYSKSSVYEIQDGNNRVNEIHILMDTLFNENEMELIKFAGIFGIYFFSIFIIMHF